MGQDLAAEFVEAADLFRRADEVLGRNLSEIAWHGPIEELTRTSNCQPALYVHGLACLAVLREIAGELPITAAAGLSLGEWTAHAAAGTFSFEDGLRLVEQRGQFHGSGLRGNCRRDGGDDRRRRIGGARACCRDRR